ncbi:MAG: NUDIX domain-containing protein [Pseudomonadota bacterium]
MSHTLFVYGTLCDHELRDALLSDAGPSARPAAVTGYCIVFGPDGAPTLRAEEGARAEGFLLDGLTDDAFARLRAYEGAGYRVAEMLAAPAPPAEAASEEPPKKETALAFLAREPAGPDAAAWSLIEWRAREGRAWRAAARALGPLFEAGAADDYGALAELWPDLVGEALAASGAPGPIAAGLGPPPAQDRVVEEKVERAHDGYFKLDRLHLRHPLLAEDQPDPAEDLMSERVVREVFRSGPAAVVLPYDPQTDRVMLIQQFRVGPFAAGDPDPWLIEAIAGRLEPGELDTPEDTVRREASEEAQIPLGRLVRVMDAYASPGAMDEVYLFYIGEARLPSPANGALAIHGVHGLDSEAEDIRSFTLSLDDALAAVSAGEIRNAPTALVVLWLGRNRARLRAAWSTPSRPSSDTP